MENRPFWNAGPAGAGYPKLTGNQKCDVLVCGAGISGALCAYRLAKSGLNVILIDAGRAGNGVSAGSTAKITSQHGLIYHYLIKNYGKETAEKHYSLNQKAISEYSRIIAENKIDCGFTNCGAVIYTNVASNIEKLEQEFEAVKSMGGYAEMPENPVLPFPARAALRFPSQARFDPVRFIDGLLKKAGDNLRVYENTKAIKYYENKLITEDYYEISAKNIIISTHYPFINRYGMYYSKLRQDASLLIAGRCGAVLPDFYLALEESGFTMRPAGNGYLIFGGEGHRTGASARYNRYERLIQEAKKIFPDFEPEFYWSAQDCMSPDRLPYIGRYSRITSELFTVAGFGKWGMSQAMAASMILTDIIKGVRNEFEDIYKPSRLPLPESLPARLAFLAGSAAGLIKGNLVNGEPEYEEPPPGRGGVYNHKGSRAGVYKDLEGKLHAVLAVCTHLGCKLSWNADDNTYDCPCHGSKFDIDGNNIYNPALKPLKKYDPDR